MQWLERPRNLVILKNQLSQKLMIIILDHNFNFLSFIYYQNYIP